MCGRYGLWTPLGAIAGMLGAEVRMEGIGARYNIAPTQTLPVAREPEPGARELVGVEWGLIPFWAKDPKETRSKYGLINARAESVAEKPAFKGAFRRRRCLVPADGFFEWQAQKAGPKQPYFIRRKSREPMFFAGLWEHWEGGREGAPRVIESYAIIVGEPNALLGTIHDRMPVVLGRASWDLWLDPGLQGGEALHDILRIPCPAEEMEAFPVSRRVNDPKHDDPGVLEAPA